MWFAFGLVTLLLGFTISMIARSRAGWKGDRRGGGEVPAYEFQQVFYKKRLTRVRIGMPAPKSLQFRVRKERGHDRFFKAMGISVEIQVSDPQFDDAVYLESDVEALGWMLMQNSELRAAIVNIFLQADASRFKKVLIRCSHGRVWIEVAPRDAEAVIAADSLATHLGVLAKALTTHRTMLEQQEDPFVRRAILVLSISTATAVLGIYGLIRGGTGRTDILDSWQLFVACVVPGAIGLGIFVALIVAFLGRSSRTHLVLVEAVLVGGVGFVLGLFGLAREMNVEFDPSPAQSIEISGARTEHKITRGRRGSRNHHYYLHIADWRVSRQGAPLRLELSSEQFRQLENQRNVTLHVKSGSLGFEWVESIVPRTLE